MLASIRHLILCCCKAAQCKELSHQKKIFFCKLCYNIIHIVPPYIAQMEVSRCTSSQQYNITMSNILTILSHSILQYDHMCKLVGLQGNGLYFRMPNIVKVYSIWHLFVYVLAIYSITEVTVAQKKGNLI